jgi:hypothetical protein
MEGGPWNGATIIAGWFTIKKIHGWLGGPRPGKRLHNYGKLMKNPPSFNGTIDYFDWAIFKFANCSFTRPGTHILGHLHDGWWMMMAESLTKPSHVMCWPTRKVIFQRRFIEHIPFSIGIDDYNIETSMKISRIFQLATFDYQIVMILKRNWSIHSKFRGRIPMLANFPVFQWVKYGVSQRKSWVPGWWLQWSSFKDTSCADHHAIKVKLPVLKCGYFMVSWLT